MDFYKATHRDIRYHLQNLRQLVFEVTDRCNLNCKYCCYSRFYRGYDIRKGSDISFTKAKLIVDYLYDLWKDNYSDGSNRELTISFYGGEPLLNVSFIKQVIDYVERLKLEKNGRICSYSMTTNAILLNQYMDYLVEKKFNLLISLDGDKFAQSYRIDHSGKNSFERVFSNIKLLQEKHPEYFKSNTSFNSVLHNRNEIESIYQFIHSLFDKMPLITPLNEVGICEEKKEKFIKIYQNPVKSFNRSNNCEAIESEMFMRTPRVAQLSDYIMRQSGNAYHNYNELYINKDKLPLTAATCVPFSNRMFITVNGKILPCERISQQFSLGQVHEDRVELNEEYIADKHNFYVSKFVKQCSNCASNRFCPQCVYQVDNLCKDDTCCPTFLSNKELERENDNIFNFLQEHPHYYNRILEEVKITV